MFVFESANCESSRRFVLQNCHRNPPIERVQDCSPLLYSLFVPLEREILLEVGTLVAAHGNEFWQKYLLSDLLFAVLQASFHPLPHIQLSLAIGILCEKYFERKLIFFCLISLLVLGRKSLVLVVSRTNKLFSYFFKLTFPDCVGGKNEKYGFLPDMRGVIFPSMYG